MAVGEDESFSGVGIFAALFVRSTNIHWYVELPDKIYLIVGRVYWLYIFKKWCMMSTATRLLLSGSCMRF